jgi:DNA-binding SARP family transcriptional activator
VAGSGDLHIQLLGGLRVAVDGRIVGDDAWRLRKARGLVKLLALAPGHRLHRDQVIEILWPHLDPDAANNNLYYALHVARRALEAGPVAAPRALHLHEDQLRLRPAGLLWVDAAAFEEAAAAARRGTDPTAYAAAVALFTGDLLPEDRYADWAAARREQLRDLYLELVFDWARLSEAAGDVPGAIAALRHAVAQDPPNEDLRARLIRLYALDGQRHSALRQYRVLEDTLRRDLEADPDPATQRLRNEIAAHRFPPVPSSRLPGAEGRGRG